MKNMNDSVYCGEINERGLAVPEMYEKNRSADDDEALWNVWRNLEKRLLTKPKRKRDSMISEEIDGFPTDGLKLWSTHDGKLFFPVSDTKATLPPGVYEARMTGQGQPFFEKIDFSASGLIRFEDSNIDIVVGEISSFWKKKDLV